MAANGCARILAILGGLIITIDGIIQVLGELSIALGFTVPGGSNFGILSGLVRAIVCLVVGVLILMSAGVIKGSKVSGSAITLLILGILGVLFSGYLGGVLVIIAAILLFL